MPLVAARNIGGTEIGAQYTFTRRRLFDLSDDCRLARSHALAQRPRKRTRCWRGRQLCTQRFERNPGAALGHLFRLARKDASQNIRNRTTHADASSCETFARPRSLSSAAPSAIIANALRTPPSSEGARPAA